MRLLVIGSGGREHAIGKKLLASPEVSHVFCAKGNAGMTQDGIDVVPIAETDHAALIDFAKAQQIDWVFIGPEGPLFHGLSDAMRAAGLTVFAPSRAAAMLECSKDFAKSFMVRHHIPTARYQSFDSFDEAWTYVQEQGAPIVVKADGLAAGKGVVVAETLDEAEQALRDILLDQKYAAQSKVVIESFLSGEEFSLFAFVKDNRFYCTPIAQDHKRAYDGAPHAFVPQRQLYLSNLPSQLVFQVISMHFTATLLIPATSNTLKTSSINGSSTVKLQDFTTDLLTHLRTL